MAAGDSVGGGQQVVDLGFEWMGAPNPLDSDPQHWAKAIVKSPGCPKANFFKKKKNNLTTIVEKKRKRIGCNIDHRIA